MPSTKEFQSQRLQEVKNLLKGKRITDCFYMSKDSMEELGWWGSPPLILELGEGLYLYAMSDGEGNNGGRIAVNDGKEEAVF